MIGVRLLLYSVIFAPFFEQFPKAILGIEVLGLAVDLLREQPSCVHL